MRARAGGRRHAEGLEFSNNLNLSIGIPAIATPLGQLIIVLYIIHIYIYYNGRMCLDTN